MMHYKEGSLKEYLEPKAKKFIDRIVEISWSNKINDPMTLFEMAGYEAGVREMWSQIQTQELNDVPSILSCNFLQNFFKDSSYPKGLDIVEDPNKNENDITNYLYRKYRYLFGYSRGAKDFFACVKSNLKEA